MIDYEKIVEAGGIFRVFKAEWLNDEIYELFQEPVYQHELTSNQPCVLFGGRGSGKTTALLGLTYEAQYRLTRKGEEESSNEFPFFGIFHRIDGVATSEFEGDELSDSDWNKLFGHYWNLAMVENILRFGTWLEERDLIQIDYKLADLEPAVKLLGLPLENSDSLKKLLKAVKNSQRELSVRLGAIADEGVGFTSSLGKPVNELLEFLRKQKGIENKGIFYIVDEYENLTQSQQRIVNTLIKYSAPLYSFKIGVREYGIHTFETLSPLDRLEHPADYVQLTIEEKFTDREFRSFADRVCATRMKHAGFPEGITLNELLGDLSNEEEALLLESSSRKPVSDAVDKVNETSASFITNHQVSKLDCYILNEYAKHKGLEVSDVLADYKKHTVQWKTRLGNYRYHSLFSIRAKSSGVRKYYCGFGTFSLLAGNNIRALMELVDQSIFNWARDDNRIDTISPRQQTEAVQYVGERRLKQLEGRAMAGHTLSLLVKSLGRVFGLLAGNTFGHSPETNQFEIEWSNPFESSSGDVPEDFRDNLESLLREGIMNLAFMENPSTKFQGSGETKGREFHLHPVFSAYFNFSYRRKRKLKLSEIDLYQLTYNPKIGIPNCVSLVTKGEGDAKGEGDEEKTQNQSEFDF